MKPLITFDFWDTIVLDDSDEPKRQARGLKTKEATRIDLLEQAIHQADPKSPITRTQLLATFNATTQAFREQWLSHQVTWTVRERLGYFLNSLKLTLPEPMVTALIDTMETMEVEITPELLPGIESALQSLSHNYQLGIISDTIYSPGRSLKLILEKANLLSLFTHFHFSDELGFCKPDQRIFKLAIEKGKVSPQQWVHIGDREQNDILGPKSCGGKSILTTVCQKKRVLEALESQGTQADQVCHAYDQLPELIAEVLIKS